MLKQRILTAIILIPLLIIVTLKGSSLYFAILIGVFVVAAAHEWTVLAGIRNSTLRVIYSVGFMLVLIGSFPLRTSGWILPLLYISVIVWCLAIVLIIFYQLGRSVIPSSVSIKLLVGCFILVPSWLGLLALHTSANGPALVLLLFVVIWAADCGAYFIGRRWGRRRLANRVSPGKSWEGVAGGLLFALIAVIVYTQLVSTGVVDIVWLTILCLITIIFSVAGDLIESAFKRHANIKDSGSLLPGHGGVLDRIDSLTAAVPVFVSGLGLIGVHT